LIKNIKKIIEKKITKNIQKITVIILIKGAFNFSVFFLYKPYLEGKENLFSHLFLL
jgi:hypothetical protein